ncbi:MAG: excisionase family DNA-binding protein [Gemmatimonadetes bacterium]|nr:cobalamin-dependent protein [Gemmatimonadota bacterium]NNM05564.1 excisionase family DNA-binding protein [Gemmatimonadota bacterium]
MSEHVNRLRLTSSRVADLLGVHASTVKRWCDDGTLQSERTEGGHRRIPLADAMEAARAQDISTYLDPFHPWEANVWLAVTDVEERQSFDRLHNLALGWLTGGNPELMGRLLFVVGTRPDVPFTLFLEEGIRAFMARVGDEWQSGRLGVGEEHMASQVVMEVLLRLRPGWDNPRPIQEGPGDPPPVAVVGAIEGDHHHLGAQAVRVLLERDGWRVYYLGADVPVEEFGEIQRAQGATLVCISFSPKNTIPDLQRAVRVLSEFYRPEYPYALGLGGSFKEFASDRIPGTPFESLAIPRSTEDFLDWARSLLDEDDSATPRRVA